MHTPSREGGEEEESGSSENEVVGVEARDEGH